MWKRTTPVRSIIEVTDEVVKYLLLLENIHLCKSADPRYPQPLMQDCVIRLHVITRLQAEFSKPSTHTLTLWSSQKIIYVWCENVRKTLPQVGNATFVASQTKGRMSKNDVSGKSRFKFRPFFRDLAGYEIMVRDLLNLAYV